MEATLKFNLPEEQSECDIAFHAMDFALAIQDLDNELRGWLKYGHKFKNADEALEKIRDVLHESLKDNGVSLDMLN